MGHSLFRLQLVYNMIVVCKPVSSLHKGDKVDLISNFVLQNWIDQQIQKIADQVNFIVFVESYLNTEMCKFESSQSEESRAQPADFSKACNKLRAVNYLETNFIFNLFRNDKLYHMHFVRNVSCITHFQGGFRGLAH